MTKQQFYELWTGKYCEVAGSSALNQCVDLANAYIRDVLGFPIIEWTNAVDFPLKANKRYDFIFNSPTNIPLEGDLVIWAGTVGHIAIFIEGNANTFRSFDQNYPTGTPCHVQNHTYANVLGWMRPKPELIAIPKVDLSDLQPMQTVYKDIHKAMTGKDMPDDTLAFRMEQRWNTIQVIIDYLTNDDEAKTYWKVNFSLTNYSVQELFAELLKRLKLG